MRFVSQPSNHRPPRGFTLVEMMVAVALLVLMMTILVSIFASATGAITEHRAYAALDMELRRVDSTIRQDLRGVTVRMTPAGVDPLRDARESRMGYFEYAENSFADAQGEDTDDTLRFTAKAPDGQPFTGRIWVRQLDPDTPGLVTLRPRAFTSQYAEIIYFLRNGNLYRRVFLIDPDQKRQENRSVGNLPSNLNVGRIGFATNIFQPLSAISSAETPGFPLVSSDFPTPDSIYRMVSWLGFNDLSSRPSQYPANVPPESVSINSYAPEPNSLVDLADRESRAFNPRFANDFVNISGAFVPDGVPDDRNGDGVPDYYPTMYSNSKAAGLLNDNFELNDSNRPLNRDLTAFPFIYPHAYSKRAPFPFNNIHIPDPDNPPDPSNPVLDNLHRNHAPLEIGDNLPFPESGQTWWGFPTWRETLSRRWTDPIKRLNDPEGTPFLTQFSGEQRYTQSIGLSVMAPNSPHHLPPVLSASSDGAGGIDFNTPADIVWEDDLLLSGVRSFDVKAYDPNAPIYGIPAGYYDLGYAIRFKDANNLSTIDRTTSRDLMTLGHEGRIPPLLTDFRADPQFPNLLSNLGDDGTGVVRLQRVWDSWSTTYTNAPAIPINPMMGPPGNMPPAIPSYPAPYPVPLRAIQIQIRVVDPSNQRVKSLTIKQDFSDKL